MPGRLGILLQLRSEMSSPVRFLVVDDNADSRFLLVKTLMRKFPNALLQECQSGEAAVATAASEKLAAVIAHRGFEEDGVTLVRRLREANAEVPLVMVSGIDRTAAALAAGADAFLHYDEWLRIGTVVADTIAKKTNSASSASSSSKRVRDK